MVSSQFMMHTRSSLELMMLWYFRHRNTLVKKKWANVTDDTILQFSYSPEPFNPYAAESFSSIVEQI